MRTVRARTWRELVKRGDPLDIHPAYRHYPFFTGRRNINRLSLMGALLFVSTVTGLYARTGLVLLVALGLFLVYLYLRARATAEALRVRRLCPRKALERDTLEVSWEVTNHSAFAVGALLLVDRFEGAHDTRAAVWLEEPIGPGVTRKGSYRKVCDAGMGSFDFGPLQILVCDPLGVFEFIVTEDEPSTVEVYPRLEPIPQLALPGASDSFLYGIYDLPARGNSVNFSGIRDYQRGDPLKHIAWRLSTRHGRLLVKQFEKLANTEVSVLLNMDAADHAGRKSESTWEYAKDAALALLTQSLVNGNSLQLLSNRKQVGWGRGEPHANLIARVIFDLFPETEPAGSELAARFREQIPVGSTAIYVGPALGANIDRLRESLLKLQRRRVSVLCVLPVPGSFLEGKTHGENRIIVDSHAGRNRAALERLARELRLVGIPTFLLECGAPIGPRLVASQRERAA